MFDLSGEKKQAEMGAGIPGNSIVEVEIKLDDESDDKGLKRNKGNDKDMVAVILTVTSEPFKGATIYDYMTIAVDGLNEKGEPTGKPRLGDKEAKNGKTAINLGRRSARGMLDSVAGLNEDDVSDEAAKMRRIPHFRVFEGKKAVVKTKLDENDRYAEVAKYVTKGEDHYDEAKAGESFVGDIEPKKGDKKKSSDGEWGNEEAPEPASDGGFSTDDDEGLPGWAA